MLDHGASGSGTLPGQSQPQNSVAWKRGVLRPPYCRPGGLRQCGFGMNLMQIRPVKWNNLRNNGKGVFTVSLEIE
jgi:hypothetical protein